MLGAVAVTEYELGCRFFILGQDVMAKYKSKHNPGNPEKKKSASEMRHLFESDKANEVMREFRRGRLRSSNGRIVQDISVARAIALSMAAKHKKKT